MTEKSAGGRLSSSARCALLDSVRRTAKPALDQPARSTREVAPSWDVSFETLPGYRMIKTQEMAGGLIGISNPFYRVHEVRAGARSRVDGRDLVNYASYDYLGLNGHPEITAVIAEAAADWGTSVSASRLTAGERPFHRDFEADLAELYGAQDSLLFVSGHATNVSAIASLVGPKDLVIHDALAHNSIVVGAELSRAHRRLFAHNDMDALEALLAATRADHERCLIITEGLFSMDGDGPDLARLVEIKRRWGAWLMIDEAHSLGVLGATGRGIAEHAGVNPSDVDIWMGTLSKTLVGCGGYIASRKAVIDYLKFQAPGMVYSVGLPATVTAASHAALKLMLREPERVARLQANGRRFVDEARAAGLDVGTSWGLAVTPVIVGDSLVTVMLADRLFQRGINAFPIIPPGVPEKSARLRFFLSSEHTFEDIDATVAAVAEELARLSSEKISVSTLADRIK